MLESLLSQGKTTISILGEKKNAQNSSSIKIVA